MLKDKTPKQRFYYIAAFIVVVTLVVSITPKVLSAIYPPRYNATINEIQFNGLDAVLEIMRFSSGANENGGTSKYQISTGELLGITNDTFPQYYSDISNIKDGVFSVKFSNGKTSTIPVPMGTTPYYVDPILSPDDKYVAALFYDQLIVAGEGVGTYDFNTVRPYVYDVVNARWSDDLLGEYYDDFYTYYGDQLNLNVEWNDDDSVTFNLYVPGLNTDANAMVDDFYKTFGQRVGEYVYDPISTTLTEELSFTSGLVEGAGSSTDSRLNEVTVVTNEGVIVTWFDTLMDKVISVLTFPLRFAYGTFSSTISVCEYQGLGVSEKPCWVDGGISAPTSGMAYLHITNPIFGIQSVSYVDATNKSTTLLKWFATRNQHYVQAFSWDNESFVVLQVDDNVGLMDLRTGQWAPITTVEHNQNVWDYEGLPNQSYNINVY